MMKKCYLPKKRPRFLIPARGRLELRNPGNRFPSAGCQENATGPNTVLFQFQVQFNVKVIDDIVRVN